MQVAAIIKARTLAFIDIDELNRHGKIRFSDILPPIVARYDFQSFPTKAEDFDVNDKGVAFGSGRIGDIVIDVLKIYSGLIYVETLSSTEDSRKVILDMLEWGATALQLTYSEGMIRHWAYVSQLTFFSDLPLLRALSAPLDNLAQKTSRYISEVFKQEITYHPINMVVGHDPALRKNAIASFTIQQRVNVDFGDNKFFSEAPLPTEVHVKFLEELEVDTNGPK